MHHLRLLRIFNQILAVYMAVVAVVGLPVLLVVTGGGLGELLDEPGMAVGFVLAGMAVFAIAVFYWILGKKTGEADWRVPQTVVAVLSLGSNPPFGIVYGIYALWVCWFHRESREAFDATG